MAQGVTLVMQGWPLSVKRAGRSGFRVGDVVIPKLLRFPPDERIVSLWKRFVKDGGELSVVTRGENYLMLALPVGIRKYRRAKFLAQLEAETYPVVLPEAT